MVSATTYNDLITPSGSTLRIRLHGDNIALEEAEPLGGTNFSSVLKVNVQVCGDKSRDAANVPLGAMAVAVKRVLTPHRKYFEAVQAAFNLIKALGLGKFSVVELLADPLTTQKAQYLFLPLADGDMEQSLKTPEFFNHRDSIRAQMAPLAEGVSALHGARLAHCDLKHKNILIFTSPGGVLTLKIADFGHSLAISPGTRPAKGHFCKGSFSAPETWREEAPQALEPVNIWALGCMFMEMVAFVQAGCPAVTRLRETRTSCVSRPADGVPAPQNTFHDTRSLKVPLNAWLQDLRCDPEYGRASVCFQAMLQPEPRERPSAKEVFKRI